MLPEKDDLLPEPLPDHDSSHGERERSDRINVGKVYLRRAFRLFPPLLVTLVIAYSLVILGLSDGGISWTGVPVQLLYFANYYGLFFDPGNTTAAGTGILWSRASRSTFT